MNESFEISTRKGNITRLIATLCMVIAVFFAVFSASDVHADEIFSNPIDHVQLHENHSDSGDNHNDNNGHPSGVCFHSSCHLKIQFKYWNNHVF